MEILAELYGGVRNPYWLEGMWLQLAHMVGLANLDQLRLAMLVLTLVIVLACSFALSRRDGNLPKALVIVLGGYTVLLGTIGISWQWAFLLMDITAVSATVERMI